MHDAQMNARMSSTPSPAKVFISSTSFDLSAVRQELEQFLSEHGYLPVLFESAASVPSLDGPGSALRHALDCDICVLIIGSRYGSRKDGQTLSFTHAEYRTARDAGKPIFAFIQKETLVKLDMYVTRMGHSFWEKEEEELFKFILEISEDRSRFTFSSLPELKQSLLYQLSSYYGYLLRTFSEVDMFRPVSPTQWLGLGDRYWNAAQFGPAIACYRRGAEMDGGIEPSFCISNLARALRTTGRPREALKVCEEGLKRYPKMRLLYTARIYSLAECGEMEAALQAATEYSQRHPKDWKALDTVRYLYERMGDSAKALDIARKVLELEPDHRVLQRRVQDYEHLAEPD